MAAYEQMEGLQLICQGAEGKVYATSFLGRDAVCKERLPKSYRLAELDSKINKQRLVHEARCIAKCSKVGIPVPCVFFVDVERNRLYLERIAGRTVKQVLWQQQQGGAEAYESAEVIAIAQAMGRCIGLMHDSEIAHGDLTTSNMLWSAAEEVVLIDFGLGSLKPTLEDKAVDLYVLERALVSTHAGSEGMLRRLLAAYGGSSAKGPQVLAKLEAVRMRGRKRDMLG